MVIGAGAADGHVARGVIREKLAMERPIDTSDRLLTRAQVERRTGLGRTAIYRMMRAGEFPEPYKVGRTAVRWSEREIEAWVAALPRSHGDGIHRARKSADEATS